MEAKFGSTFAPIDKNSKIFQQDKKDWNLEKDYFNKV